MLAALGGAESGDRGSVDMRARYQRAGLLWKLPMSKPSSEKWQKRLCVAKDGYILYYNPSEDVSKNFSTKPKGVLPLGGAKVELVERGPKGSKFGIKVSHPDFYAGRALILSVESADAQKQWLTALQDCSRVTMENALLGDSMIEKLRACGTTAEKEKEDAMLKLQEQAMALKAETDEKLRLQANQENVLKEAAEIEERAKAKAAEVTAALAEVEARRLDLEAQAASLQGEVDARASALAGANQEYDKLMALLASAQTTGAPPAQQQPGGRPEEAGSLAAGATSSFLSTAHPSSDSAHPGAPSAGAGAGAGAHSTSSSSQPTVTATAAAASTTAAPGHGGGGAPDSSSASSDISSSGSGSGGHFAPMSPASTAAAVHRAEAFGVAGMSRTEIAAIEARARQLEDEKMRLEQEKRSLERSVKDMTTTTANLQSSLLNAEEMRRQLQEQLSSLNSEETDLLKERALRLRLEKKLKIAEESLKRLDGALRRNGVRLDVDVFADVKTLMAFFEERIDEARRDAHRIDIMKNALQAKKRYLVASAGGTASGAGADDEGEEADERDDTWDSAPAPAPAPATPLPPPPAAPTAPAGRRDEEDDRDDDGWSSDGDGGGRSRSSSKAASMDAGAGNVREDAAGPLPAGWTLQRDDEGDSWYYNEVSGLTSWVRPNPDGSVPPTE